MKLRQLIEMVGGEAAMDSNIQIWCQDNKLRDVHLANTEERWITLEPLPNLNEGVRSMLRGGE